jgi:hypothetical protein
MNQICTVISTLQNTEAADRPVHNVNIEQGP